MEDARQWEQIRAGRECDWAWTYAVGIAARQRSPRKPRHRLPVIARAIELLRAEAARTPARQLAERFADIQEARRLWQFHGPAELTIQSWLLAREPIAAAAARIQRPLEVIAVYEQLFFNVIDRLDAPDWIFNHAIHQYEEKPGQEHAALLRQFAYCGGPLVLEEVMPHLLNGFNFNATRPDVRTVESRRRHQIRLLIHFLLLPDDAETQQKVALLLRRRTLRGRRGGQSTIAPAQTDVETSLPTAPEPLDHASPPGHETEVAHPVQHRPTRRKTG